MTKNETKKSDEVTYLKAELEKKNKELEELSNRIKYLQADFENLRKYFEKEKTQIINLSNKDLIKDMLCVLDDFEGAEKNAKQEEIKGIKIIHEKLMKFLSSKGLEPIKCVGELFNPEIHECLIKEGEDELISEELQKGYKLNNIIIRPSKVKIGGKIFKNQ